MALESEETWMAREEIDSLTPTRDFSRRDFVRTAVGSGFAAAVLPVGAQAIKTDSSGLSVGEVTVTVGDFKMPVYRAMPEGKTKLPVVLVVSEVFGVHEYIADIARRFAKLGYLALAPELFVRQGDAGNYGELSKLMEEVVSKVPDAQAMGDLDATVAWAGAHGGDSSRVGITGFCWGGRIAWLFAAHSPAVKAGVAWYGRLVGSPSVLQPKQPIDVAGSLHGPMLGLYGGDDAGISLDSVAQMKTALAHGSAAAQASQLVVYAGAPHAFHADYRPSYRADAAADGWRRCAAWLEAHGVG